MVAVPTIYDFLHERGYTTAGINWPCTRDAATLDDNFPDAPNMIAHVTPQLSRELSEGKILVENNDAFFAKQTPAVRDEVWTGAACNVIRKRKPNFMLFHLLIVDGTQHRNGPQSDEGYKALAHADKNIGELLQAIDEAGIRERTTLFITADHGFIRVSNQISANLVLRKAGLLAREKMHFAQSRNLKAAPR